MRTTIDFGEFTLMEFRPHGSRYPDSPATVECWIGDRIALVCEVEKGESAEKTVRFAALVTGAAEHEDPRGYQIVVPSSDVLSVRKRRRRYGRT
jgi:hypothetical protein